MPNTVVDVVLSSVASSGVATSLRDAGLHPEQLLVLQELDRMGINSFVTAEGTLMVQTWVVAAEGFMSADQAAAVRRVRPAPNVGPLDWFARNLSRLRDDSPGKWIAILGEEVAAMADTLPELMEEVRRRGLIQPFVTQIPAAASLYQRRVYARR